MVGKYLKIEEHNGEMPGLSAGDRGGCEVLWHLRFSPDANGLAALGRSETSGHTRAAGSKRECHKIIVAVLHSGFHCVSTSTYSSDHNFYSGFSQKY